MRILLFLLLLLSQVTFSQKVVPFLPKIFNKLPNVRDFSMNTDKNEIYFTVESYKQKYSFIAKITQKNGHWSSPKVVSFSGKYKDLEPFLSPDGLTLYFASNRKNNTANEVKKDFDIWYVTRKNHQSSWSKPVNIGLPINTDLDEFYPSVTKNGDLFFTATYQNSKGKEDIYVSRLVEGNYQKPESLSSAINTSKYEFNALVAPDESYIIFSSYGRKDGFGGGDLYISRKDKNNNWMPSENLGENINSNKLDFCPFLDEATNTLYFSSTRNRIKPKLEEKSSFNKIIQLMNSSNNGLSRIYKIELHKKQLKKLKKM